MPLFGKKDDKTDYKARLEHKLYLAREDPEPVFDISDCALKRVPSGVYSLCKVFRKEMLYMQNNHLSCLVDGGNLSDLSLLAVLDLHSNELVKLPAEIEYLKNLRILNLSYNKLKSLPDSIGTLQRLCVLNVSNNSLKDLPSNMAQLHCLKQLNIKGNKLLKKLPANLCQAKNLQNLLLDPEGFIFPPEEIATLDISSVMLYLASTLGVEYKQPINHLTPDSEVDSSCEPGCSSAAIEEKERFWQAKIQQLEQLKEQKKNERLALEKEMEEQQRKELEIQNSMKQNKGKLLEDLAVQQKGLEKEIFRVHQQREGERQHLIRQLQNEEEAANSMVSQLLFLSENGKNSSNLQSLLIKEMEEEERLLNVRQEELQSLRHRDVINAMQSLLEEECKREKKLQEYEEGRAETTRTLLSQEVENDKQLMELVVNKGMSQTAFVNRLLDNEELQRAAVAALLERGDARSWGLVQQVCLVESQLAAITVMEMERRKLQLYEQVSELSEKREALSALLMELLSQQDDRRQQLLNTLEEMEKRRWSDEHQNYWLLQYQRLLDSRPSNFAEMERNLDPVLAQHLVLSGVIHYVPLLASFVQSLEDIGRVTDACLVKAGIGSTEARQLILKAFKCYIEEKERTMYKLGDFTPTAPLPDVPSAPPKSEVETDTKLHIAECVICMDLQCEVIFVPCGHLCSCIKCSEAVSDCPMCRGIIEKKIRIRIA